MSEDLASAQPAEGPIIRAIAAVAVGVINIAIPLFVIGAGLFALWLTVSSIRWLWVHPLF